MSSIQLILVGMLGIVAATAGAMAFLYTRRSTSGQGALWDTVGADFRDEQTGQVDVEKIKKFTGRAEPGKYREEDLETKLFRAGYFTEKDRENFQKFRVASFVGGTIGLPLILWMSTYNPTFVILGAVLGIFIGYALPVTRIERSIEQRADDVTRYLPLVIEQIAIGVSSALDIGPCISHITKMATERDTHNVVTEMFVHVEKLVRSGLNLEDALMEVAEVNGVADVKHAFLFLAQCSKHGGEISRQLQELADAMTVNRQMVVEEKITGLPVKATGPLVMVFAGFFAFLFAGLVVRLMDAFSTMGGG